MARGSGSRELDGFVAKFDDGVGAMALAVLGAVRKIVPGATELVYDAYNALSIGFGVDETLGGCFLHVAVYPRHVNLGFNRGAELDDPHGLLEGSGARIRHVTIASRALLVDRRVLDLVRAAAAHAGFVPKPGTRGAIVVKAVYARQRPRRPSRGR